MIQGRCPICKNRFQAESLDLWPSFPFCSDRCKLIDLGRWIDGDYSIPGKPEVVDDDAPEGASEPDEVE